VTKIAVVHLLNDYSGSPKVLSQVIRVAFSDYNIDLFTARGEGGFLNDSTSSHYFYSYKWYDNKLFTFLSLMLSQASLFLKIVKRRKNYSAIYVNTMLPFGAAIAGKMFHIDVIYHIHETTIKPLIFKKFLRFVISKTASKIIFVSKSLHERESFGKKKEIIIHNFLDDDFFSKSSALVRSNTGNEKFQVLMICSLKVYKGIKEFVAIANHCESSKIYFTLVLNSEKDHINKYFSTINLPKNLTFIGKQQNIHPFYQKANIVLNLTIVDQCIETFGLTILEAMAYGLPVIVPPAGGPAEIVRDGVEGYLISSVNTKEIAKKIIELSTDKELYLQLSKNAASRARDFSESNFRKEILSVFYG